MAQNSIRKFLAVAAMLLTFADAGAAFAMPIAPIANSSALSATLVRGGRGGGGRGGFHGGGARRGGAVAVRGGGVRRGGAVAVRGGGVRRGGAVAVRGGGYRGGAVVRGGGYRRGGAVVWGRPGYRLGAGRRDRGGRGHWFHHGGRRCGLLHQPAAGARACAGITPTPHAGPVSGTIAPEDFGSLVGLQDAIPASPEAGILFRSPAAPGQSWRDGF